MSWSRGPSVWLVLTGIFELLMAAFFLVHGLLIPEVLFGFGLTAVLLGLVGMGLLFWGARARARYLEAERVRTTGRVGLATVTGLDQTGVWINNNPVVGIDLLVDVPGQSPYPVTLRETVPQILVPRLSSGAPLPVKVDQADPAKVVIDWKLAGPVVPVVGYPLPQPMAGWTSPVMPPTAAAPVPPFAPPTVAPLPAPGPATPPPAERATTMDAAEEPAGSSEDLAARAARRLTESRLRAIGRRATAALVGAVATGAFEDGQPVYELTLTVRPETGEPYTVTHTTSVPNAELPGLAPGAPLPVRIDPNDPRQLVMDWHRVD